MNATPAPNLPESVRLWPGDAPHASSEDGRFPSLTCYLPSDEFATGHAVMVMPGGGYGNLSSAKEGHRPAQFLCAHGIAAAVLEYRHAPQRYPVPLLDAQRGLRRLRGIVTESLGVAASVGALGFSAGGHLAGLLATSDPLPEALTDDEFDSFSAVPDFGALIYPVVSLSEPFSHAGSRNNLLGEAAEGGNPEVGAPTAAELSIERRITSTTPPMFIVHSQNDPAVPVENAFVLARALTRNKVAVELHVFPDGGHGYGLAANHRWGSLMLRWVESQPRREK